MITLSTSAREHIIRMLKKKSSVLGIRVGVKGAGCSGFAYTLEYAYDVEEYDTVVDCQQFAWNYKNPRLRIGFKSIETESFIYKSRGFKYIILGEASEYKSTCKGYELI